jgi:NAD(P)-dependent dehydrogenase (short-subunit alcohol dehydrogenase family)
MSLQGRAALVTGASRGLGLAIARALGAAGAAVGCLARDQDELTRAIETLTRDGIRALPLVADVTAEAEVTAAVGALDRTLGGLDILVLNAGTWQGAAIRDTAERQWDLLLDLNLKGAFLALKAAIPALERRRRGTVVGIGSLGGWVGQPGAAAYAASKWGLRGLLESAALELKPLGVRVALVHPHNMNTAGAPIAAGSPERDRALDAEDVASLVAWICSAPDHVAVGNVTIWPRAAGIASF